MAEIKSFPNNQDVYVGAEWVMKWLHGRTSGVFGAKENLATTAVPSSMSIEVSDGVGWLSNASGDGVVFWNDSEQTSGSKLRLTHDVADSALDRIDRVVVSWQTTNYVALPELEILKGTPASKPVAPSLTNNSTLRQISIAAVKIPAGSTNISSAMITDERLNKSVCGIVTETVVVDTTMADKQMTELLLKIEENLTELISSQIPSGSVTREKLAKDALYSPIEKVEATKTLDGSSIGKTIRTSSSSTDYVINVKKDSTIPNGSEIAILRDYAKTCKIIFGSDARAGIVGMSDWITACTLSIEERFSMIALKKIVSDTNYDYWVVTGDVEVLE